METFKAIVTKIVELPSDGIKSGQRQIWISKVHNNIPLANQREWLAYPPSNIPYSLDGGGQISIPTKGSLCVAVLFPGDDYCQILSYTQVQGTNFSGTAIPDMLDDGDIVFSTKGLKTISSLRLSKSGASSLFSSGLTYFTVHGGTKSIESTAYSYKRIFAGGYELDRYLEEDPMSEFKRGTEHREVYTKTADDFEKPAFSDRDLESEQFPLAPGTNTYDDKVVITAGTIKNNGFPREKPLSHVYGINTRQSVSEEIFKDTVTDLRVGYQKTGHKYSKGDPIVEGNIIDWTAKQVLDGTARTWTWKYGNQEGELFRHQINENFQTPLGTFTDPLGEGKGYEFILNDDSIEDQLIERFSTDQYLFHTHHYPNFNKTSGHSFTETIKNIYELDFISNDTIYNLKFDSGKITISVKNSSIEIDSSNNSIKLKSGELGAEKIIIGANGEGNKLVTENWIKQVFDNHIHPTSNGPTSKPLQMPLISEGTSTDFVTYVTKAQ